MVAQVEVAVKALTAVMQESLENSKILKTIDTEISKALGLLVDLVLMPFLPILVYGIIKLYEGVMDFGKWWKDVTGVLKKEGLLGLIKLSISSVLKFASGLVDNLLKFLFGDEKEKKKAIDAFLNFLDPVFALSWMASIIEFIYGPGTAKMVKDSIVFTLTVAMAELGRLLGSLIGWIFGAGDVIEKTALDFTVNIPDPLKLLGTVMNSILNFIFGENTEARKRIEIEIELFKSNPLDTAWKAIAGLGGAIVSAIGLGGEAPPQLASGGYVQESGLAVIHKGETVVPAGQGGINITINGTLFRDEEDMYQKVVDRIRGDLYRSNV